MSWITSPSLCLLACLPTFIFRPKFLSFPSSCFSYLLHLSLTSLLSFTQPNLGFRIMDTHSGAKLDSIADTPCRITAATSSLDKMIQLDSPAAKFAEMPQHPLTFSLQRHAVGAERAISRSLNLWSSMDFVSGPRHNSPVQLPWDNNKARSSQHETGLFSSSLSDLLSRNLQFASDNTSGGHVAEAVPSHYENEETFESLEEMEAQTIGNLLPTDDELLFGVVDGLENTAQPRGDEDTEDVDVFSSVGGMDLGDDASSPKSSCALLGRINDPFTGEHPYGERPSRTLLVKNINSNVEDSELHYLFEQFGDICTLYTACKHKGFVMVSYYDIRAARNALKALHNKPLRHGRLDIHYSIPKDNPSEKDVNEEMLVIVNFDSSVSNDDFLQIFGAYGEIKEIRGTPHRSNQKSVEYYDVRAAADALHVLNQSDIAGNKIKLESRRPRFLRQSPVHSGMVLNEYCQLLNQSKSGYSHGPHGPVSSSSIDSVSSLGTNVSRATVPPFMEKPVYHGISCSVPNGLPSLVRAQTTHIQPGFSEFSNSVGQSNIDSRGPRVPLSFPAYNDGFANGAPCNSNNNKSASAGFLPQERAESPHLGRISSSSEMGNAYGTSRNGSGHLHGNHYMWSNSNYSQSPTFVWPNSHSASSRLCNPEPQPRLHGLRRSPSHILNSSSPVNIHHVGSAPAASPYLQDMWDSMSPNVFPHVRGNCMDLPNFSRNVGPHAHQRDVFMYPSRGHMNMVSSFESGEHARSRRNHSFSTPADNKKLYELDIDRISRGEDKRTTLMLKNIPNKYTSKMLMAAIDELHRGTYDFIYLPIDFKNKCNVGYAFINMVDPSHIIQFYETFNGKRWEKFNSEKVASLAYARIQGKSALITHFQNSSLMNEDKRCRPILFRSDGHNAGDQVPFPMGVNTRSRSGRSRSNSIEDTQQGTAPNLPKEEYSSGDSSSSSVKDLD